jgi:hypothetical protein
MLSVTPHILVEPSRNTKLTWNSVLQFSREAKRNFSPVKSGILQTGSFFERFYNFQFVVLLCFGNHVIWSLPISWGKQPSYNPEEGRSTASSKLWYPPSRLDGVIIQNIWIFTVVKTSDLLKVGRWVVFQMGVIRSSETSVSTYRTTWCCNLENDNTKRHRENVKYHKNKRGRGWRWSSIFIRNFGIRVEILTVSLIQKFTVWTFWSLGFVFRIFLKTLYHLNQHQNVRMIPSCSLQEQQGRGGRQVPKSKSTLYVLIMTLT